MIRTFLFHLIDSQKTFYHIKKQKLVSISRHVTIILKNEKFKIYDKVHEVQIINKPQKYNGGFGSKQRRKVNSFAQKVHVHVSI